MMNGIKMAADITHVIFDLDGLLIDTEVLYTTCTQAILDPYGKKYTSELKMKVMGRPRMESARVIIEATEIPYEPQQFTHELYDLLYTQFPSAQYMPGTE
jgi:pseudouridine-5'-monophosphatase